MSGAVCFVIEYEARAFLARGRWLKGDHVVECEFSVSRPAGSLPVEFVAEAFRQLRESYGDGYAWTLSPVE